MHVLILHGIQGRAGENWGQWLHDGLTARSYDVLMPTLPNADHPDRQAWLAAIEQVLEGLQLDDVVIVGHSLGVTSALDFIEQSGSRLKGLISVAGFAQDYGMELNSYFLREKAIDFAIVRQHIDRAQAFYGDDDPYVTQEALAALAHDLAINPVVIHSGGHLNAAAGFSQFPALLDAVVELG